MNKLFRFLDVCREGFNRQNDRLTRGVARWRTSKDNRKNLAKTTLRIEGLEERQLLAVTAGAEIPEWTAAFQTADPQIDPIAVSAETGFTVIRGDSIQQNDLEPFYAVTKANIDKVNAYLSQGDVSQVTKDYAVVFLGGVNSYSNGYRYYAGMVDLYTILVTEQGIVPENIYLVYADGTDPAVDREDNENSDMSFATDHGTSVYAATLQSLSMVMDDISVRMDAESHLLFFTYDHGSGLDPESCPEDDPEAYKTDYSDYLCGWANDAFILGADVAEQIFKVQEGYVTCVFAQCFSGGILDDVYTVNGVDTTDPAYGTIDANYTGNAHFYGMAAANHYESSWTGWDNTGRYVGFAQTFLDAIRADKGNLTSTSKIGAYSVTNNPFVADEDYNANEGTPSVEAVEHSWAMGETFDVFGHIPLETSAIVVTTLEDIVDASDEEVSLREAIQVADILVETGTTNVTITFADDLAGGTIKLTSGELTIAESITIDATSLGAKGITVNAAGNSRVFYITYGTEDKPVTLKNLTITGGADDLGAGIYNAGILTLEDCVITENVAQTGGGLYNTGRLVMSDVHFKANVANGTSGGGLYNAGTVTGENVAFINNTVDGTETGRFGGAVMNQNGKLDFAGLMIDGNEAAAGAAIASFYGNVTIRACQPEEDEEFVENLITDNRSETAGALYVEGGAFTVDAAEISGNVSGGDGGAVYALNAELALTDVKVVRNTAVNGGGLWVSGGSLKAANLLAARNTASAAGGGLWFEGTEEVSLVNTTVAGNSASEGAGVCAGANWSVANSIIAANSGADVLNAAGMTVRADAVLSSFTGWNEGKNNLVYNDALPLFADAASGDYHLTADSQAVDRGINELSVAPNGEPLEYDVEGGTRYSNAVTDLGACEYQLYSEYSLVVTTNKDVIDPYDGLTSLREAILYAGTYADTLGTTITFAPEMAGKTINLDAQKGSLQISSSMTIDASNLYNAETGLPGMTVDAGACEDDLRRVFEILPGAADVKVVINGLTITGGYYANDDVEANGAGIYARDVELALINSAVTGNVVTGRNASGAGVYLNRGSLTLKNSDISENAASGFYTYGGGVYVAGNYVIEDSSFTGNISYASESVNDSYAYGGGLYAAAGSAGYIANSVFAANTAGYTSLEEDDSFSAEGTYYAYGGGLYILSDKLTIVNTTISGNAASAEFTGFGGGVFFGNAGGQYQLANSIVLLNSASVYGNDIYTRTIDFDGAVQVLESYSTISTFVNWTNADDNNFYTYNESRDLFNVNPEFENGILANADKVDLTLKPTSQVINRGINEWALYADGSTISADIAGNPRIYENVKVDLGAYELQQTFVETMSLYVTTLKDVVDATDGEISLREAVAYAAKMGLPEEETVITFDPTLLGGTMVYDEELGEIVITASLTIDAWSLWGDESYHSPAIGLDAQGNSRLFRVEASAENVTLNGLYLVNGVVQSGDEGFGGAVYAGGSGTFTVQNSTIDHSSVYADFAYGGAVYAESDLVLSYTDVRNNKAVGGTGACGGAVAGEKDVTITGSSLTQNSVTAYSDLRGGAVYAKGSVVMDDASSIAGNKLQAMSFSVSLTADTSVLAAGTVLTAETAPEDITVSYQWYRGKTTGQWEMISGADEASYTLTDEDSGCYILVEATSASGERMTAMTSAESFGLQLSSGYPGVGETITASLIPAGAQGTFQWYRVADESEVLIEGADTASYTVTSEDIGYALKVVAVGTGDYEGVSVSAETAQVQLFSVSLSNTKPQIGETITAELNPEGAEASYQWYRVAGGTETAIEGAASASYTVTASDAGMILKVKVSGKGYYEGCSVSASTDVGVFSVLLSNTEPVSGEVLGVTLLPEDAESLYIWYRGADLTSMTATGQMGETYIVSDADRGCYIKVVAVGSGDYTGCFASAVTSVRVADFALSLDNSAPSIGETVTVTVDPASAEVTYQWYRVASNGRETLIDGAVEASYTVTSLDAGAKLKLVATGTGEYTGQKAAITTNWLENVNVTISNESPVCGETITVSWTPEAMTADVQWYRTTSMGYREAIEGAAGLSYTVSDADVGYYLEADVIGTGIYAGKTFRVWTVDEVPERTLSVTITPSVPTVGTTLTAVINGDVSVSWQWYRVDGKGETAIDGAQAAAYTVTSADIGCYLKVKAAGTGEYIGLSAEDVTSQTVAVLSVTLSDDAPAAGMTMTADLSPVSAEALYQWYRGTDVKHMSAIMGATGSSYTATSSDIGYYIRVVAIGTGDYTGYFAMATTAETVQASAAALPASTAAQATGVNFPEAQAYGAGIYAEGDVVISGKSTVSNNSMSGVDKLFGIGVYSAENVELTGESSVSQNTGSTMTGGQGGGIYGKTVAVGKSTVSNNTISIVITDETLDGDYFADDPSLYGGGIYAKTSVELIKGTVKGNKLTVEMTTSGDNYVVINECSGGGVYSNGDAIILKNTVVSGNIISVTGNDTELQSGNLFGGGVYTRSLTMSGSSVKDNKVETTQGDGYTAYGGGVYVRNATMVIAGSASIEDSEISGNKVVSGQVSGGGIFTGSNVSVTFSTSGVFQSSSANKISKNEVDALYNAAGAGLYMSGSRDGSTLQCLTVSDNKASSKMGDVTGVGVYSGNVLNIYSAKITDNKASGASSKAGGLYSTGGELTMVNVLVANNDAKDSAGVFAGKGVKMVNCTITSNKTGVTFGSGESSVYNSIILFNSKDAEGSESVNAFNTITTSSVKWANSPEDPDEDGEAGLPKPAGAQGPDDNGNIIYEDGDAVFLGEGTEPYSLADGSIAVDAGDDANYVSEAGNFDVIGAPRFNGTIDIGAYERADGMDVVPDSKHVVVTTADDVVDATDGLISLREAVAYASDGATITFDRGIGTVITLDGAQGYIVIDKDLTIQSDPNRIITITGGYGLELLGDEKMTIDVSFVYVQVQGSAASGVTAEYANIVLKFDDNHTGSFSQNADRGFSISNSTLEGSHFDVVSNTRGGILAETSKLKLGRVNLNSNGGGSVSAGGGLYLEDSSAELTEVTISQNSATSAGGGIYAVGSEINAATLKVNENSLESDGTVCGAGIYLSGSSLKVVIGEISGNTANSSRGSVYGVALASRGESRNTVEMRSVTVRNNQGTARANAYGGGFYMEQTDALLEGVDFSCKKVLTGSGYVIEVAGNSLDADSSAIGGAVYACRDCAVTIRDSLYEGNKAHASIASAGAVYSEKGSLSIYNSQISENVADGASTYGGGVWFEDGDLTLVNCTIAFNSAKAYDDAVSSYGGGIGIAARGTANPEGTVTVYNTIISGNFALSGANVSRSDILETEDDFDFAANNIINDNPYFTQSAVFNRNGDITNAERLGIYATVTGESRAINAGNNDYALYDDGTAIKFSLNGYSSGNPRVYDNDGYGVVDIGACEYYGIPLSVAHPACVVNSLDDVIDPDDGYWTLREAIYYAVEDTVITFSPEFVYGEITLNDTLYIDKRLSIDFNGITLKSSGAFRVLNVAEEATLSNVKIVNGESMSGVGGGIYSTCLTLVDSEISNCCALAYGGAIYSVGRLELQSCILSDNFVDYAYSYGGAVHAEHGCTKYGVTEEGDTGVLLIDRSTFKNNTSGINAEGRIHYWTDRIGRTRSYGGALSLFDVSTVINESVFDSNGVYSQDYLYGGAIYVDQNAGKTVIASSKFTGNETMLKLGTIYGTGGAIYTASSAGLWLTNTVFSANKATDGGAIYSFNQAKVDLLNCTIAGNTAVYGAGIYGFGTINLTNSIVVLNKAVTAGDDIYKGPGSLQVYYKSDFYAHNTLSSYTEWTNFAEPDCNYYRYDSEKPLFMEDPLFAKTGELVNAETLDLALIRNSQAINGGVCETVEGEQVVLYPDVLAHLFDEAGQPISYAINGNSPCSAEVSRVVGPTVDLGAYEYPGFLDHLTDTFITKEGIVVTTLDDGFDYSDNDITLREAIAIAGTKLENFTVGTKITFADELAKSEDLTIRLDSSLGTLVIDKSLSIDASNLAKDGRILTIDACGSEDNQLRVFTVTGKSAAERKAELEEQGFNLDGIDVTPFFVDVAITALRITGGYLTDNAADLDGNPLRPVGAGLYAHYANVALTDSVVDANVLCSAERIGGAGVFAEYGVTFAFTGSQVCGNQASGEMVTGTGAFVGHYQSINVKASRFDRNAASASIDVIGGGLAVLGGEFNFADSLASLNAASGTVRSVGGGVYATGTVSVLSGTIAGNTANAAKSSVGGGLYVSGDLDVSNTIISGNYAGKNTNLEGIILEGTNNLIDSDADLFVESALFSKAGFITNVETADFDLAKGSIAINAGDSTLAYYADGSAIEKDVVRHKRIQGDAIDIGAYEYSRIDLVVDTLKDGIDWDDGFLSLREALYLAGTESGDQIYESTITFAETLRGGTINIDPIYGQFVIEKSLTIDGSSLYDAENGVPGITVSGAGVSRVMKITGLADTDPIEVSLTAIGITGGYVSGGLNDAFGGGLYVDNTELTLTDVALTASTVVSRSRAHGGALYLTDSALQIVRGTITGNSVSGKAGSYGGGIYLADDAGEVTIRDTWLTENSALSESDSVMAAGGAVYSASTNLLAIDNSQISGNAATDGAGIASFVQGNISLVNDTIAGNTANYGGGLFAFGSVTLANTIVARNAAESGVGKDVCRSGGTSDLYQASVYTADAVLSSYAGWNAGSQNYVDSLEQPLFAISETGHYRLADNSQAIDRGMNNKAVYADGTAILTDLEGDPRVEGAAVDLGAFEYANYGVSICVDTLSDTVADDGYTSLREAVAMASAEKSVAKIYFAQEIYGGTINLESEILIASSMTIDGAGAGITVSGQNKTRVFSINGTAAQPIGVTISGLTIEDGYVGDDSSSAFGGGICADMANLSICDSVIRNNVVSHSEGITVYAYGGGIYANGGSVLISGSLISGNSAVDGGGGIYASESITIMDSEISGNLVTGSYSAGGGIYFSAGELTMTGSKVTANLATNTDFTKGGGLYLDGGKVEIEDSVVSGNVAAAGGGIYSFFNNSVTIRGTEVSSNVAGVDNDGNGFGGGIYSWGDPLTIENSLIRGNECFGKKAQGAGLYATYDPLISVRNTAVLGNLARSVSNDSTGGGIYVYNGTMLMINVTVAGNTADAGAGLFAYGLSATKPTNVDFKNTIVAENKTSAGLFADIGTKNSSYIGFTGDRVLSGYTAWKNVENAYKYISSDPLFTDAAAGDYTLADGSQAINLGNNAYLTYTDGSPIEYDLNGDARIVAKCVDLGAYENQNGEVTPLDAPVTVKVESAGANRHRVFWNDVVGADTYVVAWSADQVNWTETSVSEAAAQITGLTYGEEYFYRVKAQGASYDESDWSKSVSAYVCPMDINGDGEITGLDRTIFAKAWLSEEGDENWDPRCDIDGDGEITGLDRTYFARNWLNEVGEDEMIYPPALADAVFESEDFQGDGQKADFRFFG